MEAIYIRADHTRCLAFMLTDGIIPSNVKEGYLARLVLRRTIRFMKELNMKESLSDIMKIQLDFLNDFYPEIKESQEHIMNIINLEEDRYEKTIKKGRKVVKRTIKKLKKDGISSMPLETLIDLYDAHGMPPETVQEFATKDFEVNIPDNFFTQVAAMHESEEVKEKEDFKIDAPETDLLFYKDFHQKEATAKILNVVKTRQGTEFRSIQDVLFKTQNDLEKLSKNKELKISSCDFINNVLAPTQCLFDFQASKCVFPFFTSGYLSKLE